MKKLLLSAVLVNLSAMAQTYCTPTFNFPNSETEPISLVQFGTGSGAINNPSSAFLSTTIPKYENFTAISMQVVKGQTYNLKVKGNTGGNETNYVTVFIDWNQDGIFNNSFSGNEKYQPSDALTNSTGLDNAGISYDITVPPSALLGGTRIRIMKNYQAPAPTPCTSAGTFGQVEDYTLYVSDTAAPTCAGTDPGLNAGDTGCVSFLYSGETVIYTTVRGADGKIWLQQNLGSTQVATTMVDIDSYGDLFQWGRWDDGHQKRSSVIGTTLTPNNPNGLLNSSNYIIGSPAWWSSNALSDTWTAENVAGISDTNGCDPCKKIGQGWKIPSQDDWTSLVTSENLTNPATAFSSNLRLPANGYRSSSNGNFTFAGARGYYWSTTTSSTGAKYLYVGTTLANPAAGSSRGQGAAIRCVKTNETLGVNNPLRNNFIIHPNPTSGVVIIETEAAIENITVYNQLGQLTVTQKSKTVDLSAMPSGIYFIEVTFENNTTEIKKVIKK